MDESFKKAGRIVEKYREKWLSDKNIVSVGLGRTKKGSPAIIILLAREDDTLVKTIPPEIDGIPVSINISGEIDTL